MTSAADKNEKRMENLLKDNVAKFTKDSGARLSKVQSIY